jgi:hypothetical protein
MKRFAMPVIIVATEIVGKGLKCVWKQFQESAQDIFYKNQLHWEHRL